jgi:hypothetical protein
MNNPFFASIEWYAIYDRVQDGPWLPELPNYYVNSMKKLNSSGFKPRESFAVQNHLSSSSEKIKLEFSPAPMDRYTPISELELAKAGKTAPPAEQDAPKTSPIPINKYTKAADDEESGSEDDDDDDEEEEEEELHIRDSVFISKDDVQNRLPDWSFIDANVLMSYLSEEKEKEKEKKEDDNGEGKKKKKEKPTKMKQLLEEAKEERERKAAEIAASNQDAPNQVDAPESVEAPVPQVQENVEGASEAIPQTNNQTTNAEINSSVESSNEESST